MNKKITLILLGILLVTAQTVSARDDVQYWSQIFLKPYKSEKVEFIIFTDSRFTRDAEKLGLYFISPRMIYHYSKNLDFGMNYTYLQSRNTASAAADDSYNRQHRAELEINPQWQPADWVKLKIRNRVEFRWIEKMGTDNTRYRQRWLLEFPLKNTRFLKSIYTSSELFYDFAADKYKENRTVPLGFNFKINDKMNAGLYYMIQSQKGANDWSSNQIIGSLISLEF